MICSSGPKVIHLRDIQFELVTVLKTIHLAGLSFQRDLVPPAGYESILAGATGITTSLLGDK